MFGVVIEMLLGQGFSTVSTKLILPAEQVEQAAPVTGSYGVNVASKSAAPPVVQVDGVVVVVPVVVVVVLVVVPVVLVVVDVPVVVVDDVLVSPAVSPVSVVVDVVVPVSIVVVVLEPVSVVTVP